QADDRSRKRSWRTGLRFSISRWWRRASRSWRCETAGEGGADRCRAGEEATSAPRGTRARPVGRQRRHGQRGVDCTKTRVLSDPGETRDGSARRASFQGHDHGSGRALRAAEPARPELPAARRARRRRHDFAQDRRAGEGVFDRPAASRARAPQVSDRVLAALEGGILTATLNRPEKKNAIDTPMIDALLAVLERA